MKSFLLLLFLHVFNINAQDINGVWTGNYEKQLLVPQPRQLVVELSVTSDSVLTGTSHLYYKSGKHEHYLVRGIFRRADSTVFFREDSAIALKLGLMDNCAGTYRTKLRMTDSSMILEGKWRDNAKGILKCPTTKVFLEKRIIRNITPTPPSQVQEPKPEPRVTEVQSLIEYAVSERDSIRIDVYDNGEIDDDSVSVSFNDKLIFENLRISDKPATFYVSMEPDVKFNKVLLVAKSLGSIPPCTALMVITTKRKRYEVNLSSNMSKNAALQFFLKD